MKKCKIIVLLLTIVIIGNAQSEKLKLIDDPVVLKVFNKNEISDLLLVVDFFDSIILKDDIYNKQNINQIYQEYFKVIADKESFMCLKEEVGLSESSSARLLINRLKNDDIFNDIYLDAYFVELSTKDTLHSRLDINPLGRFMTLLGSLSKEVQVYEQYVADIQFCYGICPSNVSYIIYLYRDIDFDREVNRLVFAIHYIAILSTEEY